jgi:hypothetical protein
VAWVRIDDQFYDHPKWASAPGDSIALWLASMAWCNRSESWDGYIPAAKLSGLVKVRNVKRTVADLCERRAFHVDGDGYLIHEYAEYQQNEKVKEIRRKRSEAGKKGAAARWGERMADAIEEPMANEWQELWQTDGNENAPPPTTHHPVLLDTPPTTTTSHPRLPSAVAVVKAIVRIELGPARRRGGITHDGPYEAAVLRRVDGELGSALDGALAVNPLLKPSELASAVLNGHPRRLDIITLLEEAES